MESTEPLFRIPKDRADKKDRPEKVEREANETDCLFFAAFASTVRRLRYGDRQAVFRLPSLCWVSSVSRPNEGQVQYAKTPRAWDELSPARFLRDTVLVFSYCNKQKR